MGQIQPVTELIGCVVYRFSPLITSGYTVPGSTKPGFLVQFYGENLYSITRTPCLYSTVSLKSAMPFNDSILLSLPNILFVSAKTVYTPPESGKYRFRLSILGKAKLLINSIEAIDLWSNLPKKIAATLMLNSFTPKRFVDADLKGGKLIDLEVLLTNKAIDLFIVRAAPTPGLRLSSC